MGITEFAVMACLILGGSQQCLKHMNDCLTGKKTTAFNEYVKSSETKKVGSVAMLQNVPNADYPTWVLECSDDYRKKK